MYDIQDMTQAMQEDGFTGTWYSVIHNMKAFRVQIRGAEYIVHDQYMNGVGGETGYEIANKLKEKLDEETS